MDARYATVPLRAAGARGAVRWTVNGRAVEGERWRLEPGTHVVRAETEAGEGAEVRVVVGP